MSIALIPEDFEGRPSSLPRRRSWLGRGASHFASARSGLAVGMSARRSTLVGDHRIGLLGPIGVGMTVASYIWASAVVGLLAYIAISFSMVRSTVGRFRLRPTVCGWRVPERDPARA